MTYAPRALDALAVLGDPTRRGLFETLARKPAPVSELARAVPVTRSAVSQHLRVLKDVGLVTDVAEGDPPDLPGGPARDRGHPHLA
jgi:DNA-binding transcriptional ArsR family regulator